MADANSTDSKIEYKENATERLFSRTSLSSLNHNLTLTNAINVLWEKANITDRDMLNHFSGLAEEAKINLRRIVDLTMGIGGFIANDKDIGLYQSNESVSDLLFSIANQLEPIHAILDLSQQADLKLMLLELKNSHRS